ncbi:MULTISPECIES: DMT family transporter [Spirulina sp. CCY15215]|uniref:DMT family transporter n=1 Tax=Spirulina sp. CCY15215 TaxID=2767591 RepID=UPI001951CB90|nr:DMT family transporter [Spirulina major]
MGQLEKQPEFNPDAPEAAQKSLREITEELEHLKHSVILQLSREIEQLQERKTRLLAENEDLELQRREQLDQQHELAKQIAPALVEQIVELLQQRARQVEGSRDGEFNRDRLSGYNDNAHRLISSLDTTLRTTFRTLQQDLNSYQSTLSQQLGQMFTLEQQGEAILEALVGRLKEELQTDGGSRSLPSDPQEEPRDTLPIPTEPQSVKLPFVAPPRSIKPAPPQEISPPVKPKARKVTATQMQLGFILVLFSSFALSLQNVVISIILNPSSVFRTWNTGGFISSSVGNSLLILCFRMVVVVPLMAAIAQVLYPSSWPDIGRFLKSKDWLTFFNVTVCGFFLFASSAFMYMALGALTPGVALTLFFVFPIVTVLMSWLLFGERPSVVRSLSTLTVFAGVVLIAFPDQSSPIRLSPLGITYALAAGITFAFHVLLIQACTKKLHPIPFSVVNFAIILIFAALSLLIPLPESMQVNVVPEMWTNVLVSSLVLGGLTLLSYLANNVGISYIGAARASIFGATGPALTSLLAWLIIAKALAFKQLLGMLVVTIGVAGQNLERMFTKKPKAMKEKGK